MPTKPRVALKEVRRLVRHQAQSDDVLRAAVQVLARGFVGRLKWLLFGR